MTKLEMKHMLQAPGCTSAHQVLPHQKKKWET